MKSALNYMEQMGSFSILVFANVHQEERSLWVEDDQRGLLLVSLLRIIELIFHQK